MRSLRSASLMLLWLGCITGVVYPLVVMGLAQVLFPHEANGSLLGVPGRIEGSRLIGQPFDDPRYFWGRLSATSPYAFHAAASAGSNYGPSNPALRAAAVARVEALRSADPGNRTPIPVDLVTSSGSGLDPHVSPAAAMWQAPRVARARGIPEEAVRALVRDHTQGRTFGVLGEPVVDVLLLNRALDAGSF